MESTDKTPLIYERMAYVMADIDAVAKDAKNEQQNFKFRSIDQVFNMINPILKKHQVFLRQELLEVNKGERISGRGNIQYHVSLKIKYFFTTIDGSSLYNIVFGESVDSGDKAATKAMSFALKYCLLQAFCIPTEENDKDSHDADYSTPEPTIDIEVLKQNAVEEALERQFQREKQNIFKIFKYLPDEDQDRFRKEFSDVFDKKADFMRLGEFFYEVSFAASEALKKKL